MMSPLSKSKLAPHAQRRFSRPGRFCVSFLVIGMLSACAVGPDYVAPSAPTVKSYTSDGAKESSAVDNNSAIPTQRFSMESEIPADWWTLFKSEQLNTLVQHAILNNPTYEASIATLRQSQHNLLASNGVFYPQINAGVAGVREHTAPMQEGLQTPSTLFNLVTLSGSISYTLDILGANRRAVEAVSAQRDYQQFATKAAYVTLSANVVDAGIARAAYAEEIRATEHLITLELQQLDATKAQVLAGTLPYSSVLSLRSLIASNQAALAPLRQQLSQTENLLATLEGSMPSEATLPDIDFDTLTLPTELPLSLPSALVRQRPDILQAEAQMHAASAEIGVATAAMYPNISLTGNYIAGGSSFGHLSGENKSFWNVGPSLSLPLFRGGSLWYGKQAAIDSYQASQANYRQTVLSAFAQVANTLKALEHDEQALRAQTEARDDALQALQLLQINYKSGLVAFLDVLTADVQYQQAMITYLQSAAQRHQDTVALFVAMGGGWWNAKNPPDKGGVR